MKAQLTILLIAASLLCQAHAGVKEALAAKDRGDYETARKEFQALANKGEAKAMIELSLMYHTGDGVKQDYGSRAQLPHRLNLRFIYDGLAAGFDEAHCLAHARLVTHCQLPFSQRQRCRDLRLGSGRIHQVFRGGGAR
jgi:TPR repeat protein